MAFLDDFQWDGPVREITHGAPPAYVGVELGGAAVHFFDGVFLVGRKGYEGW